MGVDAFSDRHEISGKAPFLAQKVSGEKGA
jgi:hypothetical protein